MTQLAKYLGLSDTALSKKCKKHKIPKPPAGYWLKIQSGKSVIKAKLTKKTNPVLDTVEFYQRAPAS